METRHLLRLYVNKKLRHFSLALYRIKRQVGTTLKDYCVNVAVDIKPIYLNKRYLFENKIYYFDKIFLFRKK